jgi:aldose 1-epimerase
MIKTHQVKERNPHKASRRKHEDRAIKLVNFESGEYVSILPHLGATVRELVLKCGGRLFSVLEHPQALRETIENKRFAGVKLIPFVGRIKDAMYQFGGRTYRLRPNSSSGYAIHGFFKDKRFQLVKTRGGRNSASIVLETVHDGTTKGFPFKFSVRLTYTLADKSFSCTTEIRNDDTRTIPMGDGWHPYFRTSGSIKRSKLSLPPHAIVEVSGSGKIPTGRISGWKSGQTMVPLSINPMDAVFDLGKERRRVTTKLIDPRLGMEIQLWQDSGKGKYRYLVVYRPASGKSVAIEPWTCAPNALNNNLGLIVLKQGGKFRASYGVRLRKYAR